MKKGHRRAMIASAAVGMVAVATLSVRAARVPVQVTTARQVQTLGRGDQVVVPPGQKGATYYWLESQTKRLTMCGPAR